jgi:phenylalanyl-tRNA synthetase alpha chain
VNPVVLENCDIDSNLYSGLAFGLGIERIAMLKHGVNDIREFYKSNLDFLNQFK